jgi:CysZ protein
MIVRSARLAISQLPEREFRSVLLKSVGLTLVLLAATWLSLEWLVSQFLSPWLGTWPWLGSAVLWMLGAGLFVGLGFLVGPATAAFAGIFLDDVAAKVEERHYPSDLPGKAMEILPSIWLAARFTLFVALANLLALALVLLPFVNFTIFFFLNAWLIGREYFQFAAMRFRPEAEATALRQRHSLEIFLCGLIIAGFMAVPLLNLLTPLFATAMMVHFHKALSASEPRGREPAARLAA